MAQKYPKNMMVMQLFQVVVFKADLLIIDELFQYDITRLLHITIQFNDKGGQSSPKNINSGFSIDCEELSLYRQQLQLTKVGLRIIAELCRKHKKSRDYVVLNNKSYSYWQQAFKQFGADIRLEYYQLLEAATEIPFERRDQQLNKI